MTIFTNISNYNKLFFRKNTSAIIGRLLTILLVIVINYQFHYKLINIQYPLTWE